MSYDQWAMDSSRAGHVKEFYMLTECWLEFGWSWNQGVWRDRPFYGLVRCIVTAVAADYSTFPDLLTSLNDHLQEPHLLLYLYIHIGCNSHCSKLFRPT